MVGADHMNGGGGYSAGVAESCSNNTRVINGGEMIEPTVYSSQSSGGSYFYPHRYDNKNFVSTGGNIGGQGGNVYYSEIYYTCDSGGDGGAAGKGGTITVSQNAKIYAYNGNRYTDGAIGHEYYTNTAIINQCPIFAQSGILRKVYKLNCWWGVKENYNYEYFSNLLGSAIAPGIETVTIATGVVEGKMNVLIRDEITESASQKIKNGYQNPELASKSVSERSITIQVDNSTQTVDMLYQGIGSGAGYIEVSNGTYEVDESLN